MGPVAGEDGVARCPWAGGPGVMRDYHDQEWGNRVHGEAAYLERLTLEAFDFSRPEDLAVLTGGQVISEDVGPEQVSQARSLESINEYLCVRVVGREQAR